MFFIVLWLQSADSTSLGISRIVLLPSHELCEQVKRTIQALLKYCDDCVKVVALRAEPASSSSKPDASQIRDTQPDILIATPAQLLSHLKYSAALGSQKGKQQSGSAYLASLSKTLKHLVIDEADLVLGMGYESELSELLANSKFLGKGYQISLFSATLDEQIENLRNLYMGENTEVITIEEKNSAGSGAGGAGGGPKLTQFVLNCASQREKYLYTYAFLKLGIINATTQKVLFFLNSIEESYRLKLFLEQWSINSAVLNAELPLNSRLSILQQFNRGNIDILIATDKATGEADDDEEEENEEDEQMKDESDVKVKSEDEQEAAESENEEETQPKRKKSKSSSSSSAPPAAAAAGDADTEMKPDPDTELAADLDAIDKLNARSVFAPSTVGRSKRSRAGEYRGKNPLVHARAAKGAAKRRSSANVSRGIDFIDVGTVINFDFPLTVKNYVHRVGRTARGNKSGVALSFVNPDEIALCEALISTQIENKTRHGVPDEYAQPDLQPLPFDPQVVEGFRYRCEDVMRRVTKLSIREARLKEIKIELINSEKLKAHFEDNPRELNLLKHDAVLKPSKVQRHLASVPSYLLPEGHQQAVHQTQIAAGTSDANRNKLRREKHKAKIDATNKLAKMGIEKLKGFALKKAKGRHTVATKNAMDPLRTFRAKPLNAAAASAGGPTPAAAPRVDF
jgi:ATP-dependent RNA helicase DDX56/DBP9